jgi:hypothetical protein
VLDPQHIADAVVQFPGLGLFGHYVSLLAVAGSNVMVYTGTVLELSYSDAGRMILSQLYPVFPEHKHLLGKKHLINHHRRGF